MVARREAWFAGIVLALGGLFAAVAGLYAYLKATTPPLHPNAEPVTSVPRGTPMPRWNDAVRQGQQLARAVLAGHDVPGLSVAVAVDGHVVWTEGFGWSDVESHAPVTPLTRFRLGALSKPLTAVAAALLYDQGRLDLDAPVQRYVSAYPQKQWSVTTRQLMGDVAGVHRIRGDNNDAMPGTHCASVGQAVAMLSDDPLMFQPGTQYRYSIWGWVLVSAVVEGAAREPFARFMAHNVFEPLTMERTVTAETEDLDDVTPRHSPRWVFGIRLGVEEGLRPDYSCLAGAGAFLSTPADLVRFGSAMLQPGLLNAGTIAAFETPGRLASGVPTTYALGWTVGTVQLAGEAARLVSHRGNPAGGTVSLLIFPDLGLAIAAAANASGTSTVDPFARQVAEVFARVVRAGRFRSYNSAR
jgi:CubicO group peptidase (beta-lactamase class C family)